MTADWRFLLGDPEPATVVDFGSGLDAAAIAAYAGSVAAAAAEAGHGHGLAIACDPSNEQMASAWSSLAPGGSAFIEWTGAAARRPTAVRERLEKAGFGDVRLYAFLGRGETAIWAPIDSPEAARFMGRAGVDGRSWRRLGRRYAQWLLRREAPLLRWVGLEMLHGARRRSLWSIARRSTGEGPGGPDFGVDWIGGQLEPTHGRPSRLVRSGGTSTDQPILFLFVPEQEGPQLVVKLPQHDEEMRELDREVSTLQTLRERHGSLAGIPDIRFVQRRATFAAEAQTAVAGIPLTERLRDETMAETAEALTAWLTGFAITTRVEATEPLRARVDRLLAELAAGLTQGDENGSFRSLVERTSAALAPFDLGVCVCQHRDLGPWNVHWSEPGLIGVIDWADAVLDGFPLCDLVYHLTTAVLYVENAFALSNLEAGYRTVRDPAGATGALVESCLRCHAQALGIGPELIGPLRLLTWVIHTSLEAPEKRPDCIFLRLWQYELAAHELAAFQVR